MDLAAYAYYCATLQEVFTDALDDERMMKATSAPSEPSSFDALARARSAFTTDTLLALNLTTQSRIAWSLEPREPTGNNAHNGGGPRPDARPDPAAASMSGEGKSLRAAERAASGGS